MLTHPLFLCRFNAQFNFNAAWQYRTGTKTGACIYEPVIMMGASGLVFDPASQPAFYVAHGPQARTSGFVQLTLKPLVLLTRIVVRRRCGRTAVRPWCPR